MFGGALEGEGNSEAGPGGPTGRQGPAGLPNQLLVGRFTFILPSGRGLKNRKIVKSQKFSMGVNF